MIVKWLHLPLLLQVSLFCFYVIIIIIIIIILGISFMQGIYTYISGFSGLVVSMLASGTQVRGFNPDFSGEKNPQHAFLRRGSKAVCPMS
jgi:uncharacterized membrane protein YqiK